MVDESSGREDIERIRKKLAMSGMRLNAPLSERAVSAFELKHGVRLPDGYRDFLICLGNGGVGPYHGLLPLDDWTHAFGRAENQLAEGYLAAPSHLIPEEETHAVSDEDFHRGTLTIAVDGCGFFTLLVVTGIGRGRIVGSDGGFTAPFFYAASDFLDWYEAWLDDRLGLRQSQRPWFQFGQ